MAVLPIVLWPDRRLATRCAPVGKIDDAIRALVPDMCETMYDAPGRGLAAPQVGVGLRLFVMDAFWKEGERAPLVCLNPVLSDFSDDLVPFDEGCLSIPGVTATVMRPSEVTMDWTDLEGTRHSRRLTGVEARVALHEYDHLDGIVTFDRLTDDDRARAEAEYAA